MDIRVHERDGLKIAELVGEIDGKTASAVLDALAPIVGTGKGTIVDMSGVGYMSSAGLRMLLTLYRQAAASKSRIVLVGLSEDIEETMDTTGFLPHFTLAGDIQTGMLAILKEGQNNGTD
jgi:anti-sigma B factor antagonist